MVLEDWLRGRHSYCISRALCAQAGRLACSAEHFFLRTDNAAESASTVCRLSQCSLQGRIERAEEPGPIRLGQRGWPAGVRPQLAQVPSDLTTGKRIADIRLRPLSSGRGDDARALLEAA